jgi:hypothetical protein
MGLLGCETRSVTVREEYDLWVFEERTFRGIYELGRRKVNGEWRKLNNDYLQTSCSSFSVNTLW